MILIDHIAATCRIPSPAPSKEEEKMGPASQRTPGSMRLRLRALLWPLLVGLVSCVQLVADYDSVSYEHALAVGKKIDRFYGDLLEAPPDSRSYSTYAERYVEIETDLRSFYVRNKTRALNEESAKIASILLEKWLKYKDKHRERGAYPDVAAKLQRDRFTRLIASAVSAEALKDLQAEDTSDDESE